MIVRTVLVCTFLLLFVLVSIVLLLALILSKCDVVIPIYVVFSLTGQRGVYSGSSGVRVAYLSGRYEAGRYQHKDKTGTDQLVSLL